MSQLPVLFQIRLVSERRRAKHESVPGETRPEHGNPQFWPDGPAGLLSMHCGQCVRNGHVERHPSRFDRPRAERDARQRFLVSDNGWAVPAAAL